MIKSFNEETRKAETGEKAAIRALQAWIYLIGKAMNRQIIQYEELRELMEYPTSNPLSSVLGCIMFFCKKNDLPPLTVLVVNQQGVPGEGFTAEEWGNYHKSREEVFNYPWYKMLPPATQQFRDALTWGHKQ